MANSEVVLSLKETTLSIQEKELFSNLNLQVCSGEIVLVCGRSGVGKSSLMNVINGVYPNGDTEVRCEGLEILGHSLLSFNHLERTKYVRSIFQNARLSFAMLTPYEEMIFVLENFRFPIEKMKQKVKEQAEKFQIKALLHREFSSLSGGELQKVAFACANLVDAPLYIMDEPFANIDEESIPYFMEQIKLLGEEGKAICIIDHRLEYWDWIDRWYLLDDYGDLKEIKLPLAIEDKHLLENNGLLCTLPLKEKSNPVKNKVLLKVENVSICVSNNQVLLENLNLELHEGEMIALVGSSGSGKTSFFKTLLKEYSYTGKIEICGHSLSKMKTKSLFSSLGIVFQDPSLQFVSAKVLEELKVTFYTERESVLENLLREYYLEKTKDLSPWLISQGQQRRLAFLTMTGPNKIILLVDEPTYGQDMKNAILIMNALEQLCKEGMSCIFTCHDQRLVRQYAHKVMKIHSKTMEEITNETKN
ncbi:ATP-binding cassette domain-containing protein [uncultured Granulicatella sp.]|uniref:ATP-binding cassette domain-containing protein n=1 Tax=uncultured Granulicatella sp. TaxID=316089 RepID=UPI0028EF9C5A|nr:ATP-binding cassette domain-containing protein [uncultured Granulicatella sp.]